MMRKYTATALCALALLLTGCSKGLPSECVEMVEKMQEKMGDELAKAGLPADAMGENSVEKMEEEWAKMSDKEKEATEAMCKLALSSM